MATMLRSAKPYTRWWWFSHIPILDEDIQFQLDWLKQNGFGGVELQWTKLFGIIRDDEDRHGGPQFLDDQWKQRVEFAKNYASKLGLGCDFTFGTLWPFGGSFVKKEDSLKDFGGDYQHDQMFNSTFEYPIRGRILNHLSRRALENYSKVIGGALRNALGGEQSALFCDSWEIHTPEMWDPSMYDKFERRFGYDFRPHASETTLDKHPETFRYDYRRMLSFTVTEEFYKAFTEISHSLNSISRVQCHGSPTDLLQSYSSVDIPESETLLFPVRFSRIAASAAALAGRPVTSCETFTCMYKFPDWHFKREFIGDMKLLADGVMANGINRIVYHGMPYNGPSTENSFFATIHIGPNSPFASSLLDFNTYLMQVSALMTEGEPVHQLGVYFPVEDNFILDKIPKEDRIPGSCYMYEMRSVFVPKETEGYHPLWVNGDFLRDASYDPATQLLKIGHTTLSGLHVDCKWMDTIALKAIHRLATEGLPLVINNWGIKEPGFMKDDHFEALLQSLKQIPNVTTNVEDSSVVPLLTTKEGELPYYWARKIGCNLVLFFAHPLCRTITYPMTYLLSRKTEANTEVLKVTIHWRGCDIPVVLSFGPYQSLIVRVTKVVGEDVEQYEASIDSSCCFNPPPTTFTEDDNPWAFKLDINDLREEAKTTQVEKNDESKSALQRVKQCTLL